jgi:GNAT superfamily N-acetyltransferase
MAEGRTTGGLVAAVPFTIRPCRAADLRALEWCGEFRPHRRIIEQTFLEAASGEQLMWVADVGGFPAGQLWVELRRLRLWAARVFPALQGCGIGAALVAAAEDDLVARGHGRCSVAVETANPRALRFWTRVGYRPAARVTERWRYDTPEGEPVDSVLEMDVLEKELLEEAHALYPLDHR